MSGNHRLDIGDITQSTMKGKALENALAKTMDNAIPHPKEAPSKNKEQPKKQPKKK